MTPNQITVLRVMAAFAAMCVSTVYGRYHYAADIFGGLIVGAVGFWIAQKWETKREVEEVEEI